MATVTVVNAERTLEIEASSITSGAIGPDGHLVMNTHGGTALDMGAVSGMQLDSGSGYAKADTFSYVGATDPGAVPDGSVWFDTNDVAGPISSTSQKGLVELATNAEVQAGTDTQRAVTPAGLASIPGTKVQVVSGIVENASPSAYPVGSSLMSVAAGSGWSINGGAGTIVTDNISLTRCAQTFYENSGGTASTKVWVREYNNSVGGGGWTTWAQQMLMVQLTGTAFTQTTSRGSYPNGVSRLYYAAGSATGWDFTGGQVMTYTDTDYSQQTYTSLAAGSTGLPEMWVRTANNANGWTPWRKAVFEDRTSKLPRAMLSGRTSVTIPTANVQAIQHVNFPAGYFASTPNVVVAADTTVMGNQVQGVAMNDATASGFDIYVLRTNTTTTLVQWTAILM